MSSIPRIATYGLQVRAPGLPYGSARDLPFRVLPGIAAFNAAPSCLDGGWRLNEALHLHPGPRRPPAPLTPRPPAASPRPQGDNQYCRFLHMAYATVVPKLHCPHIGKSGGGACVEQVGTWHHRRAGGRARGEPSTTNARKQ